MERFVHTGEIGGSPRLADQREGSTALIRSDLIRRILTLGTHRIHTLPIVILMPHGGCNCRCVMCDIWKGNAGASRLDEEDVRDLLASFRVLGTRWVVLTGGEPLMNPGLFRLCALLRGHDLKLSLLSSGLLLERFARQIADAVDEVIVSLDGSQKIHDAIRRVPDAYARLRAGVAAIKGIDRTFRITGRCVIQRLNYVDWPNIIAAAHDIDLDQISFLAADVGSEAFNRAQGWPAGRRAEVQLPVEELPRLAAVVDRVIVDHAHDIASGFVAESAEKLRRIHGYYSALHGLGSFPPVRCNAPWVSSVIEADGTVRPCFFHRSYGTIRDASLLDLVNGDEAVAFRRTLDVRSNEICRRCVCTLNLRPTAVAAP